MLRRILAVPVLALVAAGFAACADGGGTTPLAPEPSPAASLSGEAIFRGLVFGEGVVAQKFPEVWGRITVDDASWTLEQRQAAIAVKRDLIADMRGADPTFFDRFRADMTSGQHLRIARAMDESGVRFTAAVEARTGGVRPTAGDARGTCVTLAVLGNVVAVVNLAGAWNVAVYANAVYNENVFWGAEQQRSTASSIRDGGLRRDEMVQMIATRLR